MSDGRLRKLERGDDAGDLAARVRLITERLRVGTITLEQVNLAALVGDGASRLVAGDATPPLVRGLNQWWIAVASHGPQVASRSFCATATLAVTPEHEPDLRRVMDWCACPCHVHASIVEHSRFPSDGLDHPGAVLSASVIESAALAAREWAGPERLQRVHSTVQRLTRSGITRPRIRGAIQSALVPWLLGDGDPLLGDAPDHITGPWTCALLSLRYADHEARALEALHGTADPTPELRPLDTLWTARLPVWPIRNRWSVSTPRIGVGGVSIESTPRVWIVRSFARWSAFVRDAELRRAHLPGVAALGRLIGTTTIVWAPDDVDLAAAAREGADLETLVGRLRATRGPPALSRLDDEALPEGPLSWWFVPLLT